MVIKEEERTSQPDQEQATQKTNGDQGDPNDKPAPNLGRSLRIVGRWKSVDEAETPPRKNKRGKRGKTLSRG